MSKSMTAPAAPQAPPTPPPQPPGTQNSASAPAEAKPSTSTASGSDAGAQSTLGGVIVPGGALMSLIGLCWLTHRFGLGAVIVAVLACAGIATAALAVRGRRRSGKGRGGRGSLLPRGGTGPGRSPAGRMPGGSTGASRRNTPAGSTGRGTPGAGGRRPSTGGLGARGGSTAAAKPAGLGAAKAAKRVPQASRLNSAPQRPSPPAGRPGAGGGGKPGGGGLPRQRAAGSSGLGGLRPGGRNGSGKGLSGKTGPGLNRSGAAGRRTSPGAGGRSAGGSMPGGGTSPRAARKAAKAARANQGHNGSSGRLRPGFLKARPKPRNTPPDSSKHPRSGKPRKPKAKEPQTTASTTAENSHGRRVRSAPVSAARRLSYAAGRSLRRHTTRTTRRRLRAVAAPVRGGARVVARYGSPVLARAWRYGSRGVLRAHMALGNVRFSTIGPNWLRPLARLFHTLSAPAARAVAWAGTLGWLNTWMYRHTGAATSPTTASAEGSGKGRRAGASAAHRPVASPAALTPVSTPSKGASVSALEPTLPLRYAAETVRNAGALLLMNPAENMVGFEATMHALTEVQTAIGDVIRAAAMNARENFKVNAAIPEAYDDTSVYAHALAGRLESIPTLYRVIHAEQIDNIENPTPQGAKWDQSANNQ
ncbi:hypothetical protein [Streptomyces sp. AA1529]|uniref:hypothetical protein n=1 Tax=Streptomyces sp. AA1529 TaxID=1203257 RepID=UPI003D74E1B4